jgi:uncharacterized membrane protein
LINGREDTVVEAILEFLSGLPRELYVFVISMLPIIELRGSIPVGAAIGLPFYINYPLSVLGNMLPVPFILLLIPRLLDFLSRFKLFKPMVGWLRRKAEKNKTRVLVDGEDATEERRGMSKRVFFALALFVAIPLPGTGAWTGALVASLFNLPKRYSLLATLIGVLLSGVVMALASYGVVEFLKIFI